MAKRSIIAPGRLHALQESNAVYVISCGIPGCPCGGVQESLQGRSTNYCERGFFSLFLQVVYGIDFARRHEVPYHVGFTTVAYCYTDPVKGPNFWNYYFRQPLPALSGTEKKVVNSFAELYPLRIWDRQHLRQLHQKVVCQMEFQPEIARQIEEKRQLFAGKKVLGVQIRATDHPQEVAPLSFSSFKQAIAARVDGYDFVYVATDDQHIVEQLEVSFGDKLLYNKVVRSEDQEAIHTNRNIGNRYQLGVDVLVDCYCLSLCSHAILMHSNISYAALLFNPDLPYTLMERKRTKWSRWKTLLAYYLNEWGIRKW